MKRWTLLIMFVLAGAAVAKDVHVWADNFGKENLDGTSKELAFGTIQDAVDAATTVNDNTIVVHPGVYDLLGNPRLSGSKVDIGAFERIIRPAIIFFN